MAVYDRRYRGYDGAITPVASRWRVFPRYAWRGVFRSRPFVGFYTLCFAWPVGSLVWIYLHHNLKALASFGLQAIHLAPIDASFFAAFLGFQSFVLGGLMALLVGPGLIAPDLANGAFPLIASRPITRTRYAAGKLATLAILLSSITWVPALVLFVLQAWLEGWAWLGGHWWVAGAIVAGSGVWIATISLLSVAISALARRKVVGQTFLLGVVIFGSVAGQTINVLFGTRLGFVFNLPALMVTVWEGLFRVPLDAPLPAPVAWVALGVIGAASVGILARRLRPFEVVR